MPGKWSSGACFCRFIRTAAIPIDAIPRPAKAGRIIEYAVCVGRPDFGRQKTGGLIWYTLQTEIERFVGIIQVLRCVHWRNAVDGDIAWYGLRKRRLPCANWIVEKLRSYSILWQEVQMINSSKWNLAEAEKKELISALSQELILLRMKAEISQSELANLIGVSRQTYGAIERGVRLMTWNTYLSLILFLTTISRHIKWFEH